MPEAALRAGLMFRLRWRRPIGANLGWFCGVEELVLPLSWRIEESVGDLGEAGAGPDAEEGGSGGFDEQSLQTPDGRLAVPHHISQRGEIPALGWTGFR